MCLCRIICWSKRDVSHTSIVVSSGGPAYAQRVTNFSFSREKVPRYLSYFGKNRIRRLNLLNLCCAMCCEFCDNVRAILRLPGMEAFCASVEWAAGKLDVGFLMSDDGAGFKSWAGKDMPEAMRLKYFQHIGSKAYYCLDQNVHMVKFGSLVQSMGFLYIQSAVCMCFYIADVCFE